jgi:hypothetical protein
MRTKRVLQLWIIFLLTIFLFGCAIPIREAVKVDTRLPLGKIDENEFTGIRFPFKVSAPAGWKISTDYPEFIVGLGYEKESLLESEVFVFNPDTQSNLQIDFDTAGLYEVVDQADRERQATLVAGVLKDELQKAFGKDLQVNIGPTKRISLKGVSVAAEKYLSYTYKGVERKQGWVYGFSEPYYIFILYTVLKKEGPDDGEAIKAILDSFEYIPIKSK